VNNSKIIDEHFKLAKKVQTITTKQDRHPNSGNLYFDKGDTNKSSFRFLTPRECFLLMGFDELDYEKLAYSNLKNIRNGEFFTRDINYKLAGNSIVVNILEQVFSQIIAINKIITSSKFDNITSRHSIQHVIND
jgi:DNA (cytosine-5)-methyltransferase 1